MTTTKIINQAKTEKQHLTCQVCGHRGANVIREQIWLQGCYQWAVWCVDTDNCLRRAGR